MSLSQVPLTLSGREQLRKARLIIGAWVIFGWVVLVAVIVAALITVKHPRWGAAITPIVIIAALLALAVLRMAQIGRDLKSPSMTRFTGVFRERLSRPLRNSTLLRVKLPGSILLLRSSSRPVVAAATEAGCEARWTATIGHVDYSTRSRLLVAVERDPV